MVMPSPGCGNPWIPVPHADFCFWLELAVRAAASTRPEWPQLRTFWCPFQAIGPRRVRVEFKDSLTPQNTTTLPQPAFWQIPALTPDFRHAGRILRYLRSASPERWPGEPQQGEIALPRPLKRRARLILGPGDGTARRRIAMVPPFASLLHYFSTALLPWLLRPSISMVVSSLDFGYSGSHARRLRKPRHP
jgi:hypothetical protein